MTGRLPGSLNWAERTHGVPELLADIRRFAVDDRAVLPQSFFTRLREAGFARIRLPEAEGGLGGDVVDLVDALVEVAAADSNLAQSWRTHVLATERYVKSPHGPRRARWLRRIADGAILGGGWTEADGSGSGPSQFSTTLRRNEHGELRLSGRKFYSTGSRYADWLEYSALDEHGAEVIAAVPAGAPGLSLLDDWTGFGQRATASGTTVLDDVVVDPGDVAPFDTLHAGTPGWQQLTLLSVLGGISTGAARTAAELVRLLDRSHDGAPLAALEALGTVSALAASGRAQLRAVALDAERAHQAIVRGQDDAAALAEESDIAIFRAQTVIVAQTVEAAEALLAIPASTDDPAEAARLRRSWGLDRFWRNARTIGTHNPVLHRLRTIAEHELYGFGRIADPEQRAGARHERIRRRADEAVLPLVRLAPSLSARLAGDPAALDAVAAAFSGRAPVLFQFEQEPGIRLDPSVAAAGWLERFPTAFFALVIDPAASGHPYNLARRLASLEQLSGGRFAWVLDGAAPPDPEFVRVVQQLLRSWPRESIAAERTAPAFAQVEAISRIGAEGRYPVAGPLNVPSSPQQLPVLVAGAVLTEDRHLLVDLLRDPASDPEWRLPFASAGAPALTRTVRAEDIDALTAIAAQLPHAGTETPDGQTLRQRLGLPTPTIEPLPGAAPRFPAGSATEAS